MYIKYDLKIGLFREIYKILAVSIIIIAGCMWFDSILKTDITAGIIKENDSIINLYAFVFKGGYPKNVSFQKIFELPVLWILFQTYLLFILGKYPFSEMNNNHGISILLKGKSKNKWYISKWVWSFIVVNLYYFIAYITIFGFGILNKYKITKEFVIPIYETSSDAFITPNNEISMFKLVLLFIAPIIASMTIASFQLMISSFASSTVGFICSVIVLITSAFYMNKYLIGNMTMWQRLDLFYGGEINIESTIVICLIFNAFCVTLGLVGFNKKDILVKDN